MSNLFCAKKKFISRYCAISHGPVLPFGIHRIFVVSLKGHTNTFHKSKGRLVALHKASLDPIKTKLLKAKAQNALHRLRAKSSSVKIWI